MEAIGNLVGWALYIVVGLFALSGLIGIARAASSGGSVSQMGLCQWGLAVATLLVFGLTDWSKLHLLWVIPVGFIMSFTPMGRTVGHLIGLITALMFSRRG